MDSNSKTVLKPLNDGDTVCIIGGGPGGSACAISILKEARKRGVKLHVRIFEQKKFREHRQYNQCIGVLSPPLEDILKEHFDLTLPDDLNKKEMLGYCLHSDHLDLDLVGEEHGQTWAVSRSRFDAFMLESAEKEGAVVDTSRVTGLELDDDGVLVYSEGENCRASVIVGAFGLDEGSAWLFERATPYKPPDFLNTIITRHYPGSDFLDVMGPVVHAFLLSSRGMEFGAVTPKLDHLSINIAGRKVSSRAMLEFLRSEPVQRLLPQHQKNQQPLNYFKGKFPISPAKHLFGDRYVTIGDAAGLIRPFKGKGINSACLTGMYAARCVVNHGVSAIAFRKYIEDCRELTGDLWYGRVLRLMTNAATRYHFMDRLLKIAKDDPVFMACMFNCVSGHLPYRRIILDTASVSLGMKMVWEMVEQYILQKKVGS